MFLSDKNPMMPVTFGYNFKINNSLEYHSGGAGYVLSKSAFEKIGLALERNFSFCPNSGVEDRDVSSCLKMLGVLPENSIDDNGKERSILFSTKK
jgi:glycoprotein-N-acetylgalactosamine 3-beta-galactosyltransferase